MMTRRQANLGILASAALAAVPAFAATQELKPIELPQPRTEGGLPLMNALNLRHSTREFSDRPLLPQTLSDLLWAAFGINRPNGYRTAPCGRYIIAIDIYVAMVDGVWIYEPKTHALLPHLTSDIRAQTGLQDFVGTAPLNLVYVAHGERLMDDSLRSVGYFARSILASSAKMFTYSAPRKASPQSFGDRWIIRSSSAP